jgi:hypothetical protein
MGTVYNSAEHNVDRHRNNLSGFEIYIPCSVDKIVFLPLGNYSYICLHNS